MTPRYQAIPAPPKADYDAWETNERTILVHEDDHSPKPTGLLDQHGVPIYRLSPRIRMGYL